MSKIKNIALASTAVSLALYVSAHFTRFQAWSAMDEERERTNAAITALSDSLDQRHDSLLQAGNNPDLDFDARQKFWLELDKVDAGYDERDKMWKKLDRISDGSEPTLSAAFEKERQSGNIFIGSFALMAASLITLVASGSSKQKDSRQP